MDRGDHDVRWLLTRELDDVLAQVGLHRRDPARGEGGIQADLFRSHALALHDRAGAPSLGDSRNDVTVLGGVARPMHARAGALGVRDELLQIAVQVQQRLVLDGAGPIAGVLPIRHVRDRRPPPLAEQGRGVTQRAPQLAVGQGRARVAVEAHVVAASTSARCRARTADPRRDSPPAICITQLASPETTASTPARPIASTFSSRIATEISGYFTEKVPPKPQHVSALAGGSSTNSAPRTWCSSRRGSSLIFKSPRPGHPS